MLFNNLKHVAPFILILLISFLILFKGPYNASNLDKVPDSAEYAFGGNTIATEGFYTITVNGTKFPPRYPPWFSLLVIAPTYIIIGNEIGNAIFAITFFAILGIAIAFLIGNKISGECGGIIAALGLLLIPNYYGLGRQIMTDVPCVSLILVVFYLYLIMRPSTLSNNLNLYAIVGIIIGFCSALRPPCFSIILPFLIVAFSSERTRVSLARSFYLLAPSIIFIGATIIYNYYTFNSIIRNGYNFWCPVPYDYFSLTFSTKYILPNLIQLLYSGIFGILMIMVAIFCLKRIKIFSQNVQHMKVPFKTVLEFMILGIGPLIVFYLLYFFPSNRFYLPFISLSVVIAGAMLGAIMHNTTKRYHVLFLFIILCFSLLFRVAISDNPPIKRIAVERIISNTPLNSIIISSIDPVYLEYFICRQSNRLVVPISRSIEYAGKLISYHVIKNPVPAPKGWFDHRCAGLLNGGAMEIIPYVASERPEFIAERIKEGIPVFIDTSLEDKSEKEDLSSLLKRFEFTKKADQLFQLNMKNQ